VLANVELLDDAGQRREALVLASRADLAAGKAEVLAVEGGAAPMASATATATPTTAPTTAPTTTPSSTPTRLKTLFVLEGHNEPLQGMTP
jgi:hypothetical protein